ncbi:MAG: isocitrate lyase/phosphoenolpyruvate mutase family protein [Rhodospirillum sp.]|nr:isocitrate lyase/phosphoenolpyruvate mutase family protein [Rhodospirillum sp.]MCF8491118.1 isocitrate lyase/phosphoenolpyruvate mutase family protein [Rhodospirillum sp.]
MPPSHQDKIARFRSLHESGSLFVMPNPWNAGSARLLSPLGFAALATTSAGHAFSLGIKDSNRGLSRTSILDNARAIAQATDLPVSADMEDGFGPTPEECAETIREALAAGLAGGSIEDAVGASPAPILDLDLARDRIQAAAEAARPSGFVLTARAENYLWERPDLADTIARLQAYSEAGADVLYAPGLPDLEAIRTVCREVDKPVNVVMGLQGATYTVEALAEAGVARVSLGGSLARAAFGALVRAAREILEDGTFTYAQDALPDREISAIMADRVEEDRR